MFTWAALLFGIIAAASAANWAVIIAGSNGFWNYRHQADVAHAYQILVKGGIPKTNIITFMYDDIAKSSDNPFPGKIFNKPASGEGVDVYAGVTIDYKGDDVTPAAFVGAITGKPIRAGKKYLKSGPEDNVFMFFSDHGGPGIICFPNDDLSVTTFIDALTEMHTKKMYGKLVFYLESCESGSMFQNVLKPTLGIYALSAANAEESSWGYYCPDDDVVDGKHIGSCLGDLFSIAWMEDTDVEDRTKETLKQQFVKVQTRTNLSHVCEWGDEAYTNLTISNFVGTVKSRMSAQSLVPELPQGRAVSVYDVKIDMLEWRLKQVKECNCVHPIYGSLEQVKQAVNQELFERGFVDRVFNRLWTQLMGNKAGMLSYTEPHHLDCLLSVRQSYRQSCGPITDYAQQYSKTIVNLCESGIQTVEIQRALAAMC